MSIGMRNEIIEIDFDSYMIDAQDELALDYDVCLTLEELSELMEENGIDWQCDIADCIYDVLSNRR